MPNVKSSHNSRHLVIKAVWNNPVCPQCLEYVNTQCDKTGIDEATNEYFLCPYQLAHIKCNHPGSPHLGIPAVKHFYGMKKNVETVGP